MKRKLLLAACFVAGALGFEANAQASYNHTYTQGVTVAAGENYFLYNIASGMFLTDGMDYGTHASVDHAGRVITLAAATNGFSIYTKPYSANGSAEKAGYMTTNGYVDTGNNDADWVFTPVNVDGYTNAYTIKNSDTQYLYYEVKDELYQGKMGAFVSVGNNTEDQASYWLLIPMSARQAVKDYTYLLRNTDFHHPWELMMWENTQTWTNTAGGKKENACAEMYGKGFDISQTISETVTNGRYKLYNQAFYNNADNANQTYLYANSDEAAIAILNAHGEGTSANMAGASDAFTAGQYVNSVETFVSDGSLKVGLKNATTAGNAWTIMDNFYLEYLGQCVMDYAVALPNDGEMAANTWYYIDITAAADNYNATADVLGDIICTTDGYTLISATTGNVTLTAKGNSLTVQRYYVKSSSANHLDVAPAAYSYELGAGVTSIANNSYVGGLTTFTVAYDDATTNDPGASFAILNGSATASLKKAGTEVTTGTLSLDGTTLTATFTGVELALSSTYTIDIAAGVVGYAGKVSNEAISVNFNTGIIADGVYYFQKKGEYKYLTRGGYYGTETVVDNYGISFETKIQPSGVYYMKNVDHSLAANVAKYLNAYTDQGAYGWTIASATGGYYIKDGDGKYLTTTSNAYTDGNGNTNTYHYQSRTANEAEAIIWNILTKSEYATSLEAKKNAEITALATKAGIAGVTTLAQLETVLSENYGETDKTSEISNALCNSASDWTAVSYNAGSQYAAVDYHAPTIQIYNCTGGITQTVSSLPEGLYKITVSATWRPGNATDATRVGNEANTTAWIYANDNITQLKGWYEGGGTINSTQNLVDNAANYLNTVYVYVDGTEDLKIGVAVPNFCQQNWCPIYNWTLTYYEAKATTAQKEALAAAITDAEDKTLGFEAGDYAPYNNIAALEALAAAKAVDTDVASGEDVVAATTALTGATWTANTAEVNAFAYGDFSTYETKNNRDYPYGWNLYNNSGDNESRIMGGSEGTSNAGLSASSTEKALLLKWNATYGETTGYTMPLKAATAYVITFKYCGWGNAPQTHVVMTDPEGNDITLNPVFKPATNDGYANASHWYDFTGYFVSTTAGDYKFNLNKVETGQQQIAIADIELRTTFALEFADGSVPTYAPGTYPIVKISRTLTANKWVTAVYPFAVSLDPVSSYSDYGTIVTLESFNDGELAFSTKTSSTANQPFLMRVTDEEALEMLNNGGITLSNVEVVETVAEPSVVKGDATFKGTYSTIENLTSGENNFIYVLSNNDLYKVGANPAIINPYRAYFQISTTTEAKLRFVVDDEIATSIDAIEFIEDVKNGKIYDLSGRMVTHPVKGLYIKDGKKIFVK